MSLRNKDRDDSALVQPTGPPSLLPWQLGLCAYIFGLTCLEWPVQSLIASGIFFFLLVLLKPPFRPAWPVLALCFFTGYLAVYANMPSGPDLLADDFPAFIDSGDKVEVTGRVGKLEKRAGNIADIFLENSLAGYSKTPKVALPGWLLWRVYNPVTLPAVGDHVSTLGRIRKSTGFLNPGGDARAYWRRRNVFFRLSVSPPKGGVSAKIEGQRNTPDSWLEKLTKAILGRQMVKEKASDKGDLPDFQGRGVVLALITGDRSAMSFKELDLVRKAGLAHSLALSGMHVGYVAAFGVVLAYLLGLVRPGAYLSFPKQKLGMFISALLVFPYVFLGGLSPSLLRAGIMFFIWGVFLFCGRRYFLLDGLFIALAAILIADPLAVYDLSLQLSALAVLGISLFFRPLWQKVKLFFPRNKPARFFFRAAFSILWLGICAQIVILPLQSAVFGELSPHLYLNLFWLPALSLLVMPLGFLGLIIFAITGGSSLGEPFFLASGQICQFFLDSLLYLENSGFLHIFIIFRPGWPICLGYFLILFALVLKMASRSRKEIFLTAGIGVIFIALPLLISYLERQGDFVRLTLLDVGQGQSILIEARGGKRILIDGGGDVWGRFDVGRAILTPVLTKGRRPSLERLVATHLDSDHAGGFIYLLKNFHIGAFDIGKSEFEGRTSTSLEVIRSANLAGLVPQKRERGDLIEITEDLFLEVKGPGKGFVGSFNDLSLVLRLVWRGRPLALIPGDIHENGIRSLISSGEDIQAEVLVLPHHGSNSSCSPLFYSLTKCKLALACNGRGNAYRFPGQKVRDALQSLRIPFLWTGKCGAITITWPGHTAEMQVDSIACK